MPDTFPQNSLASDGIRGPEERLSWRRSDVCEQLLFACFHLNRPRKLIEDIYRLTLECTSGDSSSSIADCWSQANLWEERTHASALFCAASLYISAVRQFVGDRHVGHDGWNSAQR
jgi:hypothetical protein